MHQATCPHCRAALEHDGSLAGQEVVCPSCTGIFRVGGPGEGPSRAPAPGRPAEIGAPPSVAMTSPRPAEAQEAPAGRTVPQPPAPEAPPVQPTNPFPVIDTGRSRSTLAAAQEGSAEGPVAEEGRGSRALVLALAGLVLFLLGLIGAVAAGRYVRGRAAPEETAEAPTAEHWIAQLSKGSDKASRQAAAEAILEAGPEAVAAALDAVAETKDDGNVFNISPPAVRALADLGVPAVDPLGRALASEKPNVRAGAAYILREMGAQSRGAVPALARAAGDPNARVRWYALDALAAIGPGAAPAVEALIPLVGHEERLTRRRAIAALGRIGPKAKAALPAITNAEQDGADASVRLAAELAARQINLEAVVEQSLQDASDEVKQLVKRLQDESPHESSAAARALGKLGRDAAEAVPALAQALQRDDKWVREAAAEALGEMGRDARPFVTALQAAAQDPELEVREAAQRALEKVEGRKRGA